MNQVLLSMDCDGDELGYCSGKLGLPVPTWWNLPTACLREDRADTKNSPFAQYEGEKHDDYQFVLVQ
jgi:hypothetical protein